MKKKSFLFLPPLSGSSLLRGFLVILFLGSLSAFIFFTFQSQDQRFFGARLVQQEDLADDPAGRKSRRLELEDIPLLIREDSEPQLELASGVLPARMKVVSFGRKNTFSTTASVVTEEDLIRAYDNMLSLLIETELPSYRNAEEFPGVVENSLVVHFRGSSVPKGQMAAEFDYGMNGNMTLVFIAYQDLYHYLEKNFSLSYQELASTALKMPHMIVVKKGENYSANIILTSEALSPSPVLVPQ